MDRWDLAWTTFLGSSTGFGAVGVLAIVLLPWKLEVAAACGAVGGAVVAVAASEWGYDLSQRSEIGNALWESREHRVASVGAYAAYMGSITAVLNAVVMTRLADGAELGFLSGAYGLAWVVGCVVFYGLVTEGAARLRGTWRDPVQA